MKTIQERIEDYEAALADWDAEISDEHQERDETVDELSDADYHGLHERFTS